MSIRWQPGPAWRSLSVNYSWPGADPGGLEREVTAPLEAGLALLREVENITSVSRRGSGRIELEIDPDADTDFVRFTVAATIRRLYPALPTGVGYPTIDYRPTDERDAAAEQPVLIYTLSGPDPPNELSRYAREQLAPRLSWVEDLNRIEINGGNRMHFRITTDPEKLRRAGIGQEEVLAHLGRYFERRGLGQIRMSGESKFVFLADQPTPDPATLNWAAIPLPAPDYERELRLGDLATIDYEMAPATAFYRVNGRNNLRLLVYPTPTANQLLLAERLSTSADLVRQDLPAGYELLLEKDNTEYLRDELAKTRFRTALSMGILLLFVLLAYRSWWSLLIIFYGLAVNLGLALLCYFLLGVELNLYAFAGIAVSFGIMVDNVIIMLDALRNSRQAGKAVRPAILGATLTTVAGLSVIWFLGEDLRHQLFELTRVMVINLATSLVVAIYFIPALYSRFGPSVQVGKQRPSRRFGIPSGEVGKRKSQRALYPRLLSILLRFRKTALLLVVLAFGLPVLWLPRQLADWDWYNRTIGGDYYQEELRPLVNRWLGGSLRLFTTYVYEGSGYREPEETRLYLRAALPEGATVNQLNDVLLRVEAYLSSFGDRVGTHVTRVNSGQNGNIVINFPAAGSPGFPFRLKNRLTAYAVNFGGVEWDVYGVGQGFSNSTGKRIVNFRVELRGYQQAGLDDQAERLAGLLLTHPRVDEVNTDANLEWWQRNREEFLLRYDPRRLASNNLNPAQFYGALDWFDRTTAPEISLPGGEGIVLQAMDNQPYDRWSLENRTLVADSLRFDFAQVASLERRAAPLSLHKENQQYLRLVTFDYQGSGRFGSRHLDNCLDTLSAELPRGFSVLRPTRSPDEAAASWLGAVGLAVVFIFFVCALLFESIGQAIAIVLLIPVSFTGIFLTFYLFGVRLDQGGYVSFLLVTGLAVNGIILIVNEYNQLGKSEGLINGVDRYAEAVARKFRPILLTILSTAAGLLPFLLGDKQEVFWYGLAAGTIGGLLFSMVILAFISPLFLLRKGEDCGFKVAELSGSRNAGPI